jgi:membrane-associated protease RseP (regulator of RpoE activity)
VESWIIFLWGFAVFWTLLFIIRHYLPKSVDVKPFLVMWRTTRFNNFIDRLGTSRKSLWKAFYTFGIALCVGGAIYITYVLAQNLFFLFFKTKNASPVTPLIPGLTISLDLNTLFFFGFSVAIVMILHELAHGLAARAEGIKVKNTGLLLLAVIPGAFVEPDEQDLVKAKKSSQTRVYAAGSTTNILLGIIALVILANSVVVLSPFYNTTPSGALVLQVVGGTPAQGVLQTWDAITSINGSAINSTQALVQVLNATKPNSTVPMAILRGGSVLHINFTLGTNPTTNSAFVGINSMNYFAPNAPYFPVSLPFYFSGTFSWLYLLSLNVGLINMMPIPGLDGDRFSAILLKFVLKKDKLSQRVSSVLRWGCLAILILNLVLSFSVFGLVRFG